MKAEKWDSGMLPHILIHLNSELQLEVVKKENKEIGKHLRTLSSYILGDSKFETFPKTNGLNTDLILVTVYKIYKSRLVHFNW